MHGKRTIVVYIILAIAVFLSCVWQVYEHRMVVESAKVALRNRGADISKTVGVVIRSQGRFGFIRKPRLEAALEELTKSGELLAVALLNAAGEVTASAGDINDLDIETLPEPERWGGGRVMFVNPVDIGPSAGIVLPPRNPDSEQDRENERSGDGEPEERRGAPEEMRPLRSIEPDKVLSEEQADALKVLMENPPIDDETIKSLKTIEAGDMLSEEQLIALRAIAGSRRFRGDQERGRGDGRGRGRRGPPPFGRPRWMSEVEYQELLDKQGVHAFVLSMSTDAYHSERTRDLWLRMALVGIALTVSLCLLIAWHSFERFSRLEMRLLRAREMNLHLQEMNVAAAGLAHETRNPLNIIRGLAQIISKQPNLSAEIQERSCAIAEEVDRVTGRLNQFMEFSRPPEAKPAPTALNSVISDVARALESDREDKSIEFENDCPELIVEADESLLRQVLFNLLLNAVQIVDNGGKVGIHVEKDGRNEVIVDVYDNGPGVPLDSREEIFRPYYTTSENGTGLGLAVVHQIVLAHHWEIEYILGDDEGSIFRLSGLKAI